MSASLEGLRALSTYRRLLQINDPEGLDGTLRVVRDGAGDASALSLSTGGASIAGDLTVNGTASIPYLPAGTGAVTRTVQDRLREFASVKDFGAVGDGVTNDGPALQAALDSGQPLFVPWGVYITRQPLVAPARSVIVGEDVNAYIYTDAPRVVIRGVALAATQATLEVGALSTLRGLCVEGIQGTFGNSTTGVDALRARARSITLDRVYTRFGRYGVDFTQGANLAATNCHSRDCSMAAWFASFGASDTTFLACYAVASQIGFSILSSTKVSLIGCVAEWNNQYGVEGFIYNSFNIIGCQIDRNFDMGVRLNGGRHASLIGNNFRRNGSTGRESHLILDGINLDIQLGANTYSLEPNSDAAGLGVPTPQYVYSVGSGGRVTGMISESPVASGATTLAVTATSGSVSVPVDVLDVLIYNSGANTIYVRAGTGATTATTSDAAIVANGSLILSKALANDTIAAVCASGLTSTALIYATADSAAVAVDRDAGTTTALAPLRALRSGGSLLGVPGTFANDAAAAAGGVLLGAGYVDTSGFVRRRLV
jgi:hypothetical protein